MFFDLKQIKADIKEIFLEVVNLYYFLNNFKKRSKQSNNTSLYFMKANIEKYGFISGFILEIDHFY